jgi:hypothetical protein
VITLINGHLQNQSGLVVPDGSISFQLNVDATIIAAPYGLIPAQQEVVFQFDGNGNILPNAPATAAQIYSNAELQPQNANGLGTYYQVAFYDANGARLNKLPMWWQFPQAANTTVDISSMTPFLTTGGNVIFYPSNVSGVTSVSFTGDGVLFTATPGAPVTSSGTLTPTLIPQPANTVLAGPTSGSNAAPTFRSLVGADISAAGLDTQVQVNSGGVFYADAGLTYQKTTQTVEIGGALALLETGSGSLTTIQASASFGAVSTTLILPPTTGFANQFLQTDGNNPQTLSWGTPYQTGPKPLQSITVTLTAAQILVLRTTPVLMIPAQGPNTAINVVMTFAQYRFGGTAYTGTNATNIQLNGSSTNNIPSGWIVVAGTTGFLDQPADRYAYGTPDVGFTQAVSLLANSPLYLKFPSAGPTLATGNGTMTVTIFYEVIDLDIITDIGTANVATVTLTSAQLRSLDTVPVLALAAQGSNRAVHIISTFAHYRFGTIAYSNTANPDPIEISGNSSGNSGIIGWAVTQATLGFLDQSADQYLYGLAGLQGQNPSLWNNAPLYFKKGINTLGSGDGTLTVTIFYEVIDLTATSGTAPYSQTVTLSSSQLINLHTTAVQALPAMGPNTGVVVLGTLAHYRFGTTAYTGVSGFPIMLSGGNTTADGSFGGWQVANDTTNFLDQTTDLVMIGDSGITYNANAGVQAISLIQNSPLYLKLENPGTILATGDGTLTVTIFYQLVNLPKLITGGPISVTGWLPINRPDTWISQIADGTTGNGPVVLATAPTINGMVFPTAAGSATVGQLVASGIATLGTSLISATSSASVVTVAASGVVSTDSIEHAFNAAPGAGYTSGLFVQAYVTSGNVNFLVTNPTAGNLTPAAATLNWRVLR